MNRALALVVVGALAVVCVVWQGYRMGYRAAVFAQNAVLLDRIEAGKKLEAERLKIAAERDDLSRKLEEAANADPVTVPRCLGPDRVRRLNALQ